ncbi:Reverse transcriptase domain-containing protein [Abeliophyllum distichum]|uniref:Reverse transcriptase domain-containing protein n=1 Tax=Abeliophyllum distichum TaxID=126358 RepID=A0ABD1V721_9LAMI
MSRSHDSRVRSHGRTGSQHVNLPQVFRRRQQEETSTQTCAPERDAVLQKLEYLIRAIERLEKNQPTTRRIFDSEAESPAGDESKNRCVKQRLDFSDKSPSESKGGKSIRSSPSRKAATQRIKCTNTPDELELMKQRLAELEAKQKNTPEEYTTDRHSPFTEDILAKPLPEKLKMPQLTSYEDGNDPVEDGPATYQEFLARAKKYIGAEEATSDKENDRSDRKDSVKGKEKDLKTEKKESPKKTLEFQHPGRPRPTPPRYQGYHVLNTSLENVLMKTKGKDILKKPAPMRANSSELNQRRYCRYHRSARHDTDDCRNLKGEIESLIRRGHLKEFLARPPGGGEPPQPQDRTELPSPPQPGRGTIANLDAEKFSFSEEDASHVLQPHSDVLVITMPVFGVNIHQTLVDDGSSVNVLYLRTFKQMDIDARHVRPFPKRIIADFVIVDLSSNYNAILGRPIQHELKAATSIYHYAIKFSTLHKVGVVRESQLVARSCNINFPQVGVDTLWVDSEFPTRRSVDELDEDTVEDLGRLDPRSNLREWKTEPVEELEQIEVDPNRPEKVLYIGKELKKSVRSQLTTFLKSNTDVFAWEHVDMEGIDPKLSCHKVNTSPNVKPKQQRRRPLNLEKYEALAKEVDKLLKCGFIRESLYSQWVANPVLVKKNNEAWRVCIDFTDLNKACPKDSFPLPRIDQMVDATAGHVLLSFIDAYSRYNQIAMHQDDQ